MTYSLTIRPDAELDIQDAYQYYEARDAGLGSEFVRAIDAYLSKMGAIHHLILWYTVKYVGL